MWPEEAPDFALLCHCLEIKRDGLQMIDLDYTERIIIFISLTQIIIFFCVCKFMVDFNFHLIK